jgi:hypothetical protein
MGYLKNHYALIIGITKYASLQACNGSVDATRLCSVLTDPNFCGYHADTVRLLLDEQATKDAILSSIRSLINVDGENANRSALVYFSGHATMVDTPCGRSPVLLPYNVGRNSLDRDGISNEELTATFMGASVTNLLVLIDSAHAGGFLSNMSWARTGGNVAVLASSRENELSWNFFREPQSLFTHFLIKALSGAIKKQNDTIRVMELFQYVHSSVVSDSQERLGSRQQTPVLKAMLAENFTVALFKGKEITKLDDTKPVTTRQKAKKKHNHVDTQVEVSSDLGGEKMIKILFLTANPKDSARLRLDEESRAIDQALRQAEFRDQFNVQQHWAVRTGDLQGLLLRHKPDIVHFSGHGEQGGIILEDNEGIGKPVSVQALSTLFSVLKDNIRCVVLNACYSEIQANAIAGHIDCVIGMSSAIGDKSAISFATSFYQALGYGRNVKTAFDLGSIQINMEGLDDQDIPKLVAKKLDPCDVTFA